jgi:hypothetical protein
MNRFHRLEPFVFSKKCFVPKDRTWEQIEDIAKGGKGACNNQYDDSMQCIHCPLQDIVSFVYITTERFPIAPQRMQKADLH